MEKKNFYIATLSQNYLSQALNELKAVDLKSKIVENFSNGILIVEPTIGKKEFGEAIVELQPIFIKHINAIDFMVGISEISDKDAAENVLSQYKGLILPGEKVAVQVRKGNGEFALSPFEYKTVIDSALVETLEAISEIKEPEKIISVFLNNDAAYVGLGTPQDNMSKWSGGMVHYKKEDTDISRAKYKLMEAIQVFGIDMSKIKTAIDLGAAPGGWTSVLLEYGIKVLAVDTGDMHESLRKDPNFSFAKINVADLSIANGSFDLLTSDVSWNPINTAKMLIDKLEILNEGGIAVVTIKLMTDKVLKTINEVKKIYGTAFDIIAAKQLFHNRDEITLYMKKKKLI